MDVSILEVKFGRWILRFLELKSGVLNCGCRLLVLRMAIWVLGYCILKLSVEIWIWFFLGFWILKFENETAVCRGVWDMNFPDPKFDFQNGGNSSSNFRKCSCFIKFGDCARRKIRPSFSQPRSGSKKLCYQWL